MKLLQKNIGIVAFLGPYMQNKKLLDSLGVHTTFVKTLEDLESVDALIIPGTEYIPLRFSLKELFPAIMKRVQEGMPLLLTGAASLLLDEKKETPLSCKKMNIQSYEPKNNKRYNEQVRLQFSDTREFTAVFVRSPVCLQLGKGFLVLSEKQSDGGEVIMMEQDNILSCTFYPELSEDIRIHEYFVTKI